MIIYCIEDINDLKYVGSTPRNLNTRLTEHRYKKRNNLSCSSGKLNLYNCIIYILEECETEERMEREKYWINKIECVNTLKLNGRMVWEKSKRNEYQKKWYHDNVEKLRQYNRDYYHSKRK